jgi:autotransporter-associated beta strand protein
MILVNSARAKVGTSVVQAIISSTASVRQFMCYSAIDITQAITGTIGLVKNGNGELILSGVCNYTGPTIISRTGLTVTGASTLNGVISGAGSLTKTGASNLTLGGNNTYSGGTLCSGGFITFTSGNAFGTGLFTAAGQSQLITGSTTTVPNNFQINTGIVLQYRVNTATTTLTLTGIIAGLGGNINKTSTGALNLAAATLSYTGQTIITAGRIIAAKTNGAVIATASFFSTSLSVSFNIPPTSGMTFRFFPGPTNNTYASVTLINGGGLSGSYDRSTSTLTVT